MKLLKEVFYTLCHVHWNLEIMSVVKKKKKRKKKKVSMFKEACLAHQASEFFYSVCPRNQDRALGGR